MGGEQGVQRREHLPELPQLHRAEVHTVPAHAHAPGDVGRRAVLQRGRSSPQIKFADNIVFLLADCVRFVGQRRAAARVSRAQIQPYVQRGRCRRALSGVREAAQRRRVAGRLLLQRLRRVSTIKVRLG